MLRWKKLAKVEIKMKDYIKESIKAKKSLLKDKKFLRNVEKAIEIITDCLGSGGKILIAGNGGSAADAQHFAAEIVGRFEKERKGYPAIALTTDTSTITSISNDYGFDKLFSRQIEALGKKRDVLVAISTSGNSVNIVKGVKKARKLGLSAICLLGKDGGQVKEICDLPIIVPAKSTSTIQEVHILLIHIICRKIDQRLSVVT